MKAIIIAKFFKLLPMAAPPHFYDSQDIKKKERGFSSNID